MIRTFVVDWENIFIAIYYISALESSNTTTTDGKEDSGPKSFLLPSLFPITTPLNSPRDVSPARNYEIQQRRKVRFQFVKSIQPDVSLLLAHQPISKLQIRIFDQFE